MKKYDNLYFILGFLLSIIPVYVGLGWIYIWNKYLELEQAEKVIHYDSEILFNLFSGRYSSALFALSCGLIAGILLIVSLITSINRNDKFLKIVKILVLSINVLFTFWVLFGLM
jgi:hypothetical protein